jgi:hypothetical protein
VLVEQQDDGLWTGNVGKCCYEDELYVTGGCGEWVTGAEGKETVATEHPFVTEAKGLQGTAEPMIR